jgi:hypothetical protein
VRLPRRGAPQADAQWREPAAGAAYPTRKTTDATLITWTEAKRRREGDGGGDDGGGRAA